MGEKSSQRNEVCFLTISSYEIHAGGRKIVGSAQRRGKKAVLQHGSILLRSYPELTSKLLYPPENIPEEEFYLQLKSRSAGLFELMGSVLSRGKIIDLLIEAFNEQTVMYI
jgi:lipoate-protein ligase A